MKQIEFNPLQKELARSPQAGPHPDSDLLTAFSEGTLLERERQDVFAHLASCVECRELLSAATEAAPGPVRVPFLVQRSAHPPLRAWLPWVSVAAGILIICSAGLVYRQKQELEQRATIAAENKPGPAALTIRQAPPLPAAQPEGDIGKSSANAKPLKATQPGSGTRGASTAKVTTESSIAQPSAPTQSISAFANSETARALSNISGAAVTVRPHWRIDSAGHAERSFGDGDWQPVLANESARMRVVSVFESEVWVGGENARLYHSSDNGNTWNIVPLPVKNGDEPVIVHIRFQTPQAGTVEAADGTSWTTADGGATWK
jgi:hypothetical protein